MKRKIFLITGLILMIIGGVILYNVDPTKFRYMPRCMFKVTTGLSCPGCGFQRAMHALLHGEFRQAIGYNLFFAVGFPYLFAIIFAKLVLSGKRKVSVLSFLEGRFMAYTYVVLFLIWLVVRNILNI